MTAEVAIMNKQAIALAADSAVTVSGGYGHKIFNTVNKLFTLSKYHPVGIMVYSSAEVMGVPVETVIKVFRERLGNSNLATINEYHDRFLDFLKQDQELFTPETRFNQCLRVVDSHMSQLRDTIMRQLNNEYPDWGHPTNAEVIEIAGDIITECINEIANCALLEGGSSTTVDGLRAKIASRVLDWQNEFKKTFGLPDEVLNKLKDFSIGVLIRDIKPTAETGFVIAGFGATEAFPQLSNFEFEFAVEDLHRVFIRASHDAGSGAVIIPFAQPDMIETFMEGRPRKMDTHLLRFIDRYFQKQKQVTENVANASEVHTFLDNMNQELKDQFMAELKDYIEAYHTHPVLDTVASMPKEELAIMAEALISLTATKRRTSPNAETVGGPIDVAIISKGDGFVWIKRKHYFDPVLNPNFAHNYFQPDEKP